MVLRAGNVSGDDEESGWKAQLIHDWHSDPELIDGPIVKSQ
jgi:hypothetical protein